jgi:ABC-type sugar transport system substrate-binding protein
LGGSRTVHAFFLTEENVFQREQVAAVESAARRHHLDLQVRYAESNALIQIQQLYESVHAKKGPAPDAIIVEPVAEEGMPRVARNAAAAGIGWAVLNAGTSYIPELRAKHPDVVLVGVAVDNVRAGEIQGAQALKLLAGRKGANVLVVRGPLGTGATEDRAKGLEETLSGHDVSLFNVDTNWTRSDARTVVQEWLKLGRATPDLVVGQNDEVAQGARDALGERLQPSQLGRVPFIGCDGLPAGGQELVKVGQLAATVVTPFPGERGVDVLAASFDGRRPSEPRIFTTPMSFPPLEDIKPS